MNQRAVTAAAGMIGRIPVRNVWLLFLYAYDLAQWTDRFDMSLVDDDADLATLIGRILAHVVEERLRRNLSRGYVARREVLARVRGRIDLLATESRDLLSRGQVSCRYEELSADTVRNRLVRHALQVIAGLTEPETGRRCRSLAGRLGRLGVSEVAPTRGEIAGVVIGRNEASDRLVVALAKLALDLALPTEEGGPVAGMSPLRDAVMARILFERAVGGFYRTELRPQDGWKVETGTRLHWPANDATSGLAAILPGMITDVVLTHRQSGRRLVIDTKFTGLLTPGRWGRDRIRSGYMFQMYSYLRSQTGTGDLLWDRAEGMLLHPTTTEDTLEAAWFHDHRISFATVDLSQEASAIRAQLLALVVPPPGTPPWITRGMQVGSRPNEPA